MQEDKRGPYPKYSSIRSSVDSMKVLCSEPSVVRLNDIRWATKSPKSISCMLKAMLVVFKKADYGTTNWITFEANKANDPLQENPQRHQIFKHRCMIAIFALTQASDQLEISQICPFDHMCSSCLGQVFCRDVKQQSIRRWLSSRLSWIRPGDFNKVR